MLCEFLVYSKVIQLYRYYSIMYINKIIYIYDVP